MPDWVEFVQKTTDKICTPRNKPYGSKAYFENKGSLILYGVIE